MLKALIILGKGVLKGYYTGGGCVKRVNKGGWVGGGGAGTQNE